MVRPARPCHTFPCPPPPVARPRWYSGKTSLSREAVRLLPCTVTQSTGVTMSGVVTSSHSFTWPDLLVRVVLFLVLLLQWHGLGGIVVKYPSRERLYGCYHVLLHRVQVLQCLVWSRLATLSYGPTCSSVSFFSLSSSSSGTSTAVKWLNIPLDRGCTAVTMYYYSEYSCYTYCYSQYGYDTYCYSEYILLLRVHTVTQSTAVAMNCYSEYGCDTYCYSEYILLLRVHTVTQSTYCYSEYSCCHELLLRVQLLHILLLRVQLLPCTVAHRTAVTMYCYSEFSCYHVLLLRVQLLTCTITQSTAVTMYCYSEYSCYHVLLLTVQLLPCSVTHSTAVTMFCYPQYSCYHVLLPTVQLLHILLLRVQLLPCPVIQSTAVTMYCYSEYNCYHVLLLTVQLLPCPVTHGTTVTMYCYSQYSCYHVLLLRVQLLPCTVTRSTAVTVYCYSEYNCYHVQLFRVQLLPCTVTQSTTVTMSGVVTSSHSFILSNPLVRVVPFLVLLLQWYLHGSIVVKHRSPAQETGGSRYKCTSRLQAVDTLAYCWCVQQPTATDKALSHAVLARILLQSGSYCVDWRAK